MFRLVHFSMAFWAFLAVVGLHHLEAVLFRHDNDKQTYTWTACLLDKFAAGFEEPAALCGRAPNGVSIKSAFSMSV